MERLARWWRIATVMLVMLCATAANAQATCSATNANANLPVQTPTSDFTVHGDGTVTHNTTGLMWKRCAQGQTWTGSTCTGTTTLYTWADALGQAVSDATGGYSDWRLPNSKELQSIIESCGYSPSINGSIFPATSPTDFWSSTSYIDASSGGWLVSFDDGALLADDKTQSFAARLVRIGQPPDRYDLLGPDTHPDVFSFSPQIGVAPSDVATSNTITVSGIASPAAISITGGSYSINGGAYTSANGTVSNGNTVTIRLTAAATYNTKATATLVIDVRSANFEVTTSVGPQRVFVSATTGSDSNAPVFCSISFPCRTLAIAQSTVATGGEVIALASGDYGAVTLSRSMKLTGAAGEYPAINVTSGTAMTISGAGTRISLTNFNIVGSGTAQFGISMTSGAALEVSRCTISGFSAAGMLVEGSIVANIGDTLLRGNADGMQLRNGVNGSIVRSTMIGNSGRSIYIQGTSASTTTVNVNRSLVSGDGASDGIAAVASTSGAFVRAQVTRSAVSNNDRGILAQASSGGSTSMVVNRSRVTGNNTGLYRSGTGATLYSRGNNTLSGNGADTSGTITPLSGQ